MTKVEAIKLILEDNGGIASWKTIYGNIEKYYSSAKASPDWEAGLRGVVYREISAEKSFKKIGFGILALKEYEDEKQLKKIKNDKIRMHSYIEGIMVELGNHEQYATYCANPTAFFQTNIPINQLTTVSSFPSFTYPEIIDVAKRIDVIWFSNKGYKFPKRLIEIVDSIGTLGDSLNRMYQLKNFDTDFYVLAPKENIVKIEKRLDREPYSINRERFIIKNYDEALNYYKARIELSKARF